jgi:opacity protein-like surface antigen
MKKIIALLTIVFLLTKLSSIYAEEFDCCFEESPPFYIEVLGGANFLQSEKSGGIKSDYRTGYIVSGSLGYRWCYGIRLEAEYAYRRNSLNKIRFFGRSFNTHGRFQSSSYMANVLWDLPFAYWGCQLWSIQPFVGAGIGYDFQQINARNSGLSYKESKKDFSWQVIAGLAYPLFCQTDVSLEYKFHQGGFTNIYNHSLGIGLTYKF